MQLEILTAEMERVAKGESFCDPKESDILHNELLVDGTAAISDLLLHPQVSPHALKQAQPVLERLTAALIELSIFSATSSRQVQQATIKCLQKMQEKGVFDGLDKKAPREVVLLILRLPMIEMMETNERQKLNAELLTEAKEELVWPRFVASVSQKLNIRSESDGHAELGALVQMLEDDWQECDDDKSVLSVFVQQLVQRKQEGSKSASQKQNGKLQTWSARLMLVVMRQIVSNIGASDHLEFSLQKRKRIQKLLEKLTELVVSFITDGDKESSELANEALELGIVLLDSHGGDLRNSFLHRFSEIPTHNPFGPLACLLRESKADIAESHITLIALLEGETSDSVSAQTLHLLFPELANKHSRAQHILRMLQLLCEGHFTPMQNLLRAQRDFKSENIVKEVLSFLLESTKLEGAINPLSIHIVTQAFQTLTEFVQGPCRQNQELLILNKVCELANGLLLGELPNELPKLQTPSTYATEVRRLKLAIVTMLLGLLEGMRQEDEVLVTAVIKAMSLDEILRIMQDVFTELRAEQKQYARGGGCIDVRA